MPNVTRPASRPSLYRALVLAERARSMREQPTTSEHLLFEAVRGGRLGVAFKRQVPLLGRYIADLFAPSIGLVVEVDGGYHERRALLDAKRDRALARAGYRVLRIEAQMGDGRPGGRRSGIGGRLALFPAARSTQASRSDLVVRR